MFVKPPGHRSTYRIRQPFQPSKMVNYWVYHEECDALLDALGAGVFPDSGMPESEQLVAYAELLDRMHRCRCGQARLEDDFPRNGDIRPMTTRHGILEVRQPSVSPPGSRGRFGDARRPRILRLYYCEPEEPRRVLAGLHLASKPGNNDDDVGEQQEAVVTAHRRANADLLALTEQSWETSPWKEGSRECSDHD